jgi:hypothetical protein
MSEEEKKQRMGDWLAIFSSLGALGYAVHRSESEAKEFLIRGEDAAEIYGFAVYHRPTKQIFMHDPLGRIDREKLRVGIENMLSPR